MGGRLFEAGRLLTFPTYRVGAYSRWAHIRGWALNRINTVPLVMKITTGDQNHVRTNRYKPEHNIDVLLWSFYVL